MAGLAEAVRARSMAQQGASAAEAARSAQKPVEKPVEEVPVAATGAAEKVQTQFDSYLVKSVSWLGQTFGDASTGHDNIVDSKVWAVVRRVLAVALVTISLPFTALADAVRGIAYKLPQGKLHNSGILSPTIVKVASFVGSALEPTKNFYKGTARNISDAYDAANPNRAFFFPNEAKVIIHDAIEAEVSELVRHFEGKDLQSKIDGVNQLRQELEIETKIAKREMHCPDKGVTSNSYSKAHDAMEEIQKALSVRLVQAATNADGTVDQEAVAEAVILASVGSDGKVSPQKRNEVLGYLETKGLLPGGTASTIGSVLEQPAVRSTVRDAVQKLENEIAADNKGAKEPVENKKDSGKPNVPGDVKPGDVDAKEGIVKTDAAAAVKTPVVNYDKANKILERIIAKLEQIQTNLDGSQKFLVGRNEMLNKHNMLKKENLAGLSELGVFDEETLFERVAHGDLKIPAEIVKAANEIRGMRKLINDFSIFATQKADLNKLMKNNNSLDTQLNQAMPAEQRKAALEVFERKELLSDEKDASLIRFGQLYGQYNELVNRVMTHHDAVQSLEEVVKNRIKGEVPEKAPAFTPKPVKEEKAVDAPALVPVDAPIVPVEEETVDAATLVPMNEETVDVATLAPAKPKKSLVSRLLFRGMI